MNEIKVSDERFNPVEARLQKMQKRAEEFCQGRSNFQIEKFIACDEHTPITKFRHVSHNSYVTMQEVRRMMIEKERKERDLRDKLSLMNGYDNTKPPSKNELRDLDLDIYELSRQLEEIDIRIKGLLKEVDYMEAICDQLEKENGKPFTAEQYQAEEPMYWQKRLSSQMLRSVEDKMTGTGEGNIMSTWMAMEKPILPNSPNQIGPVNIRSLDQLATLALGDRKGVGEFLLQPAKPKPTEELPPSDKSGFKMIR